MLAGGWDLSQIADAPLLCAAVLPVPTLQQLGIEPLLNGEVVRTSKVVGHAAVQFDTPLNEPRQGALLEPLLEHLQVRPLHVVRLALGVERSVRTDDLEVDGIGVFLRERGGEFAQISVLGSAICRNTPR